jgi:hypothetical protein
MTMMSDCVPKTLASTLDARGWYAAWDDEGKANFIHPHKLDFLCIEDDLGEVVARWYEWETAGGFHGKVFPLDAPELLELIGG